MQTVLDAGLFYLKRGMSVVPFKRDKSGACIKWQQYQTLHPTEDDVKGWFQRRFSNEFIAIITGKISDIMVVDCDTQEAYEKIQEFIPESLSIPTAKSPHGYHLYFKYQPGLVSRAAYMPGIDVRTDSGLIIAPPSKNGDSLQYRWLPGLSLQNIDPPAMPEFLYSTLLQFINTSIYSLTSSSNNRAKEDDTSTTVYNDDKRLQYFTEGRRDQDIFHVANSLVKGKCQKEIAQEVLKILAKNCNPPFDEKLIEAKLQSAENRQVGRERNIAGEIREWVLSTNGNFLSTSVYTDLQLSTRDERKNVSVALKRLSKEGLIEKVGSKNGEWRLIDQECKPEDWLNVDCAYKDIWLPLGIDQFCGLLPGNIAVFAGSKDAGKTAFLLNIAKENRHRYRVHYINSEMGKQEFYKRVKLFEDITPEMFSRNFFLYDPKSMNFSDYVKPGEGNLNIIDYLEVPERIWEIGGMIRKIHDRLDGALCVIGLQKKIGQDLGRGAEFSMEKARLYVSLEYGNAKIISCKNFKENDLIKGNPRGYTCKYKLVNGCKIIKQSPGWTSQIEKEKAQ